MRSAPLFTLIVLVGLPFSAYPQNKYEKIADEKVREFWNEKTSRCRESVYSRMGPYAINEYRDVHFDTFAVPGRSKKTELRIRAKGSLRQYWLRDKRWQPWAYDQVLLDLLLTKTGEGHIVITPSASADSSGESLQAIACNEIPPDEPSPSAQPDRR